MDLFDIIGPVMIGPSSSHTAGAARIGLIARLLLGEPPVQAVVGFHGSFAKTWRGHGTDRAIVGGLLGMAVDDPRLRESLQIAEQEGLHVTFQTIQLRGAHPNTVQISLESAQGHRLEMEAASVGGGNIEVTQLGGMSVDFSGKEHTLIIHHRDTPGMIAQVAGYLAEQHVNIATMQVFRRNAGAEAVMVLELDTPLSEEMLIQMRAMRDIQDATFLARREP